MRWKARHNINHSVLLAETLEHLFEAGRLDVLEQGSGRRQSCRILKCYVKSPVANGRLVNDIGRSIRPWAHRLGRMVKRYERADIIPSPLNRVPIFDKTRKIDHSAVKSRFRSVALIGSPRQRRQVI